MAANSAGRRMRNDMYRLIQFNEENMRNSEEDMARLCGLFDETIEISTDPVTGRREWALAQLRAAA